MLLNRGWGYTPINPSYFENIEIKKNAMTTPNVQNIIA